jgi:hypothetical protein
MDNLEIEIRMVRVIRKVLSILLIINAISWFIGHFNRLTAFDIIYCVLMLIAGIIFLFGKPGTEKILIRSGDESVFIKWVGRTRGKEILFTDIDRIGISKADVEIERRGMKRVKFRLDGMDIKQKREIYNFFISLSGEKNLVLERHF